MRRFLSLSFALAAMAAIAPFAWAHFSTPEPADAILLATADLIIAHRSACGEGRKLAHFAAGPEWREAP